MKSETKQYRTILKQAWYIDRFNYRELTHTFLANAYLRGVKVLDLKLNTSYIIRGLKWAARDMWATEHKHKTIFAIKRVNQHHYDSYYTPTVTDGGGEWLSDLNIVINLNKFNSEHEEEYLNETYGKTL